MLLNISSNVYELYKNFSIIPHWQQEPSKNSFKVCNILKIRYYNKYSELLLPIINDLLIKKLLEILQRIVDNGDTVIVIEHNLDVIKVADYIIDLGPDGGDGGGKIIATGTPEEVSKIKESYTGQYLDKILKK